MVKKRSPKFIIEDKNPLEEHAYLRIPGMEMQDISQKSSRDKVDVDPAKVKSLLNEYSGKYSSLHEHTLAQNGEEEWGYVATPSGGDLGYFLSNKYGARQKAMHIAQRNGNSGKIEGYITLRKTKETNLIPGDKNPFFGYDMARSIVDMDEGSEANRILDKIAKDYNLQIRYTPAKGFKFDSKKLKFVKQNSLEQKLSATTAIMGLIGGLFFLGSNLTGNVIADLPVKTTSFIGASLILIGLIASFFYLKTKKK
jgi:hypothetical protein